VTHAYVAGRDDITDQAAGRWAAEQHELGEQGEFFFACIERPAHRPPLK
jgi:hypothetical protein